MLIASILECTGSTVVSIHARQAKQTREHSVYQSLLSQLLYPNCVNPNYPTHTAIFAPSVIDIPPSTYTSKNTLVIKHHQ